MSDFFASLFGGKAEPTHRVEPGPPPPTDHAPEVWLGPAPASADLVALADMSLWPRGRERITTLQMFINHLLPGDAAFEPNTYETIAESGLLRRLKRRGVRLAVEGPAIKEWGVRDESTDALAAWQPAIRAARDAGGEIAYAVLDEPFHNAFHLREPRMTDDHAVSEVAQVAATLHAEGLEVVLVEPWPALSFNRLAELLGALDDTGIALDAVHLDVDRRAAEGSDVAGALSRLDLLISEKWWSTGVILWGQDATSPAAYRDDVLRWARQVRAWLPEVDRLIVQSWETGPSGARDVPDNLPEASELSHLGLLHAAAGLWPAPQA